MKTNRTMIFGKLASLLAVPLTTLMLNPLAHAAPFTAGDIVVERMGSPTESIANTGNTIYLDELTPNGTLVQSIQIPNSGANSLIDDGTSGNEGGMTLSANGLYLVFPGYNTTLPFASSLTASTATVVPRGIGLVDTNGNFTLAATSTSVYSGSAFRGAASDGNGNFWGSGTSTSPNTSGGIQYFGTNFSTNQIFFVGKAANIRNTAVYNGSLWLSTASSGGEGYGVYPFNGLPTTATLANTNAGIHTTTSVDGPCAFSVSPDGSVIYYADSGSTFGGVDKWTNSSSGYVRAYNVYSNNVSGCLGLLVNYSTVPPTIYTTTFTSKTATNYLIKLQDFGPNSAGTIIENTGPTNTEAFHGIAFAPNNSTPAAVAPTITSVSPLNSTNLAGSSLTINLIGTPGTPEANYFWFSISGSTTNLVSTGAVYGGAGLNLTFPNVTSRTTNQYFGVLSNASGSVTSSIVTVITVPGIPSISAISPTAATANAGNTVTFTLSAFTGTPTASNRWYKVSGGATNLISTATGTTLTLANLSGTDTADYFAVLSNSFGTATSPIATLSVIDPIIVAQPASTYGLAGGTVQFAVTAGAASPTYQWYFTDANGNFLGQVENGTTTPSGVAVVSGANNSTLAIANLQPADLVNLAVVVSDSFGTVTSSVASVAGVLTNGCPLAFWDFNGPEFTNTFINFSATTQPVPFLGTGTAMPVGSCNDPGTSPFSGSADPNNGIGFEELPAFVYPSSTPHAPNFSYGVDNFPASGGNKQNGVQFNVSTVGAKNVKLSYQARVSATASDYDRVQYTTNGTTWIDYPSSSTFGGVGSTYLSFSNDFTGFPGVANNPDFGVRIVTEFPSTATYGISSSTNYLGTANTYGTAGTLTFDVVTFFGDSITNGFNLPPVISAFANTNVVDTNQNFVINFTVTGDTTPDAFTYSAVSLNPTTVNPQFTFGGSGVNRTLQIVPNEIPDQIDAAPILVTVTDTNGDSTAAWFTLTVSSINLSPTNGLASLAATNLLANSTLTIPFTVGDDRTVPSGLTYTVSSDNFSLIPAAGVVVDTSNPSNPTLTIVPAANQEGTATISITLNDNDPVEPRSTTANIGVTVRPNTNVLAIDNFEYDGGGALDVKSNFWQHVSGTFGGMQWAPGTPGFVTVNAQQATENLQTPLAGAPYSTNSPTVLYSSFQLNMEQQNLPAGNGTYITLFNDGTLNTANVEDCLIVATNDAAFGFYRVGLANIGGSTAISAATQMLPLDLAPGINYTIVTALTVSNGFTALWVNPVPPFTPDLVNTFPPASVSNLFKIAAFEIRESGQPNGGISQLSELKVGTTFDSVFPSLSATSQNSKVILKWSDPTLQLQAAPTVTGPYNVVPGATSPYTNTVPVSSEGFFQLTNAPAPEQGS